MENFFVLIVSALVSLHQYLPEEGAESHKYFTNVQEMESIDLLPAANQSCLFLYELSKNAGIDSFGSNGALGLAAGALLDQGGGFTAALSLVESDFIAEKLESHEINPIEFRDFLAQLCAQPFNPYAFSQDFQSKVQSFLDEEVNVLSDADLNSLGHFQTFGGIEVFDESDQSIGFSGVRNRRWTPYHDLSHGLILSLLAAEDEQFFSHSGVNTLSVARIIKEALSSEDASGGSTVTMQLLKNLYFDHWEPSTVEAFNQGRLEDILRKVREWYWAKPFEKHFSREDNRSAQKEKVLELYFNIVNFGLGIQGIHQASHFYFAKQPSSLSVSESAFLVSLLKRPSFYSEPRNYVEWTKPRRDDYIINRIVKVCEEFRSQHSPIGALQVLDLCKSTQMDNVTEEQLNEIMSEPLPLWKPFDFTDIIETSLDNVDEEGVVEEESSDSLDIVEAEESLEEETPIAVQFSTENSLEDQEENQSAEAHIPFLRKARTVVNNLVSENPGFYRELKVKTTMKPELQSIIYDVVRNKLDQYDAARSSRSFIDAALDDRGVRAELRKEDLGFRFIYNIERFTGSQWSENKRLLYSVTLSSRGRKKLTLTNSEIDTALSSLNYSDVQLVRREVLRALTENSNEVGQVNFIEIGPTNFRILSPQELRVEMSFESEALQEEFDNYYSADVVSRSLLRNSLLRLDRYKQRKTLEPLVRTENGRILNLELENAHLSSSDRNRAASISSGQTTFFWGRKRSTETGEISYRLESPKLQAAVLVVDSRSGKVLSNFAGYEAETSFFDRSLDMKRQYGSALKPWIYHLALDNGLTLSTPLNNSYVEFPYADGRRTYRPRNFSSGTTPYVSLMNGMIYSYNIATFSLLKTNGWDGEPSWYDRFQQLRTHLEEVGIYDQTENQIPIVLGAQVSTLQRLVDSYTYFSNGENIKKSYMIEKVEDYFGNTLMEKEPETINVHSRRFSTLSNLQQMLAGVTNRGTAARLRNFTRSLNGGVYQRECFNGLAGSDAQSCFGGKTGTSNDGRDTWFIGFSKNFVIGVWVGYDDFRSIPGGATGGQLALPIFMDIVEEGLNHLPEIESFLSNSPNPQFNNQFQNNNFNNEGGLFPGPTINIFSRCQCERVANQQGFLVGYRIISPSQPEFRSEMYDFLGECLQAKAGLTNRGVLQCQ